MISNIIQAFKSLMKPHDKMILDLEAKRAKSGLVVKDCKLEDKMEYGVELKNTFENPAIVSPSNFLGEGYGIPIYWDHEDDLFVEFQILDSIVAGDVNFFMGYVGDDNWFPADRSLSMEEKKKYPQHFYPCFSEVEAVIDVQTFMPLQYLNAEQECFIVTYENVLGLLIFSGSDRKEIVHRSYGLESEGDHQHYQFQFMRFDKAAVERMNLVQSPLDYHQQMHAKGFPTLRVNFAKYNNE